ncbi:unnamed protein product [Heterobilharzia americana]|nr:unnamed protein product [Heterobilharzia americana]
MAYSPGDKIFAKVKGHPHWPSRINLLPEDVPIPKGKYPIFFYGTHEVYFLTPKDIFPYEKFKHKYGVTRNKPAFQAGLREIEENPDVLLYNKDPEAEVFLAQFYSFKRECQNTNVAAQTPSQKRSKSTSAETEHGRLAKRPHTESPNSNSPVKFHPRTSQRGGRSSLTKSKRQSSATEVKTVRPSVQPAPVESANYVPEDSQRVSTLRLRIRKHSTGLILSPDSVSPSSPSTPESTATLEARHAEPERIQPSSDRLKIIIRQNTTMSPIMSTEEKMKQRPVVSVTPTPNTAGSNSINQSEAKRPRSTAVVTPLLRNVLPELSDDSSDSDVSKTDESLKMNSTEKKGKSSYMEEKSENSQNLDLSVHRTHSIRLRRKFSKQVQDSSEITISHVEDSQKTTPITSPELSSSNWHKTVALTSKCGDIKTNSTISLDSIVDSKSDVPSTPNHEISKDKEQQLKDLDTEERLLLIDRSIKSSLVQGHEDIATCVDKLEHLDKMAISLPIMARCWTVVETIRKCRRYKRSLEVKIAAQKVFNKFLQLYATADKNELDLAHAELVKHQQRHMRKHSAMLHKVDSPGGSVSASITSLPPYTGPKSMADLFQLTIRPTKDVHDSKVIHHDTTKNNPETLQSPSSVDATPNSSQAFERCERPTNTITTSCVPSNSATETIVSSMFKSQSPLLHSSSNVGDQLGVSLQDIPLPEEAPVNLTQPKKTTDPSSPITEKTKDFSELLVPEDIDDNLVYSMHYHHLFDQLADVECTRIHRGLQMENIGYSVQI